MPRLPQPGGDKGQWGTVLNDFLSVEHNTDGSLKPSGTLGAYAPLNNPTFTGTITIPTPTNPTDAATKAYVDSVASSGAPNADASTPGLVQLTGHLTGAYNNPQLANTVITNAHISGSAAIAQSKIANLTSDLADKADADHTHTIANTTGLQAALDGKAATGHIHAASAITFSAGGSISATNVQAAIEEVASEAAGGDPSLGGDLSGTASNAQIVANAVDTTELANNAVTEPKLSVSNSPSSGQFLSWNGSALTWDDPSVGGGGGLAPFGCLVVSNDMPAGFKSAATDMGGNVFVCDGSNDEVQINAAIELATALNSRNGNSPAGAQQWGLVQLTGGRFNISAPIQMRTGITLRGNGELTELRAVSLSSTAGYPAGISAVIKQSAVTDHIMTVESLWLNGDYASGGSSSHGIVWSGPGGSASGYPDSNPDPSNHIRNVRINKFWSGTRHGIWFTNNCRGNHVHNVWIRECSGNGFWADGSPDGVISSSSVGGCQTGIRLEGANWRITGTKTYYCGVFTSGGTGFYIGSGRHTITGIESQDDVVGINLAGIKCALAGVTVDCAEEDGIIISGSRNLINSLAVYQRDGGEFATTTNGIRFSGTPTDLHVTGFVEEDASGSGVITNPVTGTYTGTRNFIRISDDSQGSIIAHG